MPRNIDLPFRFNISLRIYSGKLPPAAVSKILEIDATRLVATEAQADDEGGTKFYIGKLNGWFLESEGRVESLRPREHLDYFIRIIPQLSERLPKVLAHEGARADWNVVVWSEDGSDVLLTATDLQALAALNIPLNLSYRAYGDQTEVGE